MNAEKEPLTYIILVNYNGFDDTVECVKSIKESTYHNYQIVIVDNHSNDSERLHNDIYLNSVAKIIYASQNGGFSYGNNLGIEVAINNNADYIFLLNNDTVIENNTIELLVAKGEHEDCTGIITGMVHYFDNTFAVNYFHGTYDRNVGKISMVGGLDTRVTFVCGCMMMLKTSMIKQIGKLDESFFMYSEDLEYSCRAQRYGWKLVSEDDAVIYHKISSTVKQDSDFQRYYIMRNDLKVIQLYSRKKWLGYIYKILSKLKGSIRNKQSLKPIIDGIVDFCCNVNGRSLKY